MTAHAHHLLTDAYRVEPDGFWIICQMRGDDGYDRMEEARRWGWTPIASWGRDGWDLGSWPLVVIYHRHTSKGHELAENVEGDVTVSRYPTQELRDAATDQLAFWHWKHHGEEWVAGVETVEDAPHLRGPFSWDRCRAQDRPT